MNAVRLYERFTVEQLTYLEAEACELSNKKRAEACRWAITHHLADRRKDRGDPVNNEGYSGRNSKKRR